MSTLEFVAALVDSLAWPVVVLVIVWLLRSQIRGVLKGAGPLRRVKAGPGGVEAEWDRKLSEVGLEALEAMRETRTEAIEESGAKRELPPGRPAVEAARVLLAEELAEEAMISPRAAVLEAFSRVDRQLRSRVAAALGDPSIITRWPTRRVLEVGASQGIISREAVEIIEGLTVLRNLAAHTPGDKLRLDAERALDYAATADRVSRLIPMEMDFEELDGTTRDWMLRQFEAEEASGNPSRSKALSPAGLDAFPDLMRNAIRTGNEVSLAADLNRPDYWDPTETYVRNGVTRERKRNIAQAAQRLALTEFNTWYVAGLAHRLVDEGETEGQVYRAAEPKFEHASCSTHEGRVYSLADIIAGHRAGYWPEPGDPDRFSIPAGPGCHHTIRRVR